MVKVKLGNITGDRKCVEVHVDDAAFITSLFYLRQEIRNLILTRLRLSLSPPIDDRCIVSYFVSLIVVGFDVKLGEQ